MNAWETLKANKWMIWAFIPWLSGVAYAYVGRRMWSWPWGLFGIAQLVPLVMAIVLSAADPDNGLDSPAGDAATGGAVAGWILSMALVSRARLALAEMEVWRSPKRQAQPAPQPNKSVGSAPEGQPKRPPPEQGRSPVAVLNTVSADELRNLQVLTEEEVLRFLRYRTALGGFKSLGQVASVVGIDQDRLVALPTGMLESAGSSTSQ